MENASKALLMAGGLLIGILVLSLIAYLFVYFGNQSQDFRDDMYLKQLTKYNAQYTVYDGRSNLTVYDVVTAINIAYENNVKHKEDANYNTEYHVSVKVDNAEKANPNQISITDTITDLIQKNRESVYTCKVSFYYSSGRVKEVSFTKKT